MGRTSMSTQNETRVKVWRALANVALPDSRFHFDFAEFIADFQGSGQATAQLLEMSIYQEAHVLFITPDNCLEKLRSQTIRDDKVMLMTTYGIRRGFVELRRKDVPPGIEDYAVLLDVIERLGRHISLADIQQRYYIDLLVTGGSAVSRTGVRIGKGHGYFDIEWAMLYSLGVVDTSTPIVDIVHDCQLVDEEFPIKPYDAICDYIITPTRKLFIPAPQKPTAGILWDLLEPGMMERISCLSELKALEQEGKLRH